MHAYGRPVEHWRLIRGRATDQTEVEIQRATRTDFKCQNVCSDVTSDCKITILCNAEECARKWRLLHQKETHFNRTSALFIPAFDVLTTYYNDSLNGIYPKLEITQIIEDIREYGIKYAKKYMLWIYRVC